MGLTRQISRSLKRKGAAARKRRKALIEPLEPRLLLDADLSFTMTGGANDLTLKLGQDGDELQIINTDTSVVLDSLALSGSTEVEIIGSDEDDTLRLELDFDALLESLSIVFQAGTGVDSLVFSNIEDNLVFVNRESGGVTVTNGEYTSDGDGTISVAGGTSTTTGNSIEKMLGGQGDNTFVFESGAALLGTIDGGSGGRNTLDYSAYLSSDPVVVDLASGIATGTAGVSHIHNVIGGPGDDALSGTDGGNILSGGPGNDILSGLGGEDILAGEEGDDTLIGPEVDSLWEITGANEGLLNKEAEFSGIENLGGSANNQDGFVFFAEGSISGIITGGEGGSDGFIVEDPAEEGPFTIVNPDISGAGTVTLYGKTINYAGMEPIVDSSVAETVVIHGSVYDDVLVLEDADADSTGQMQIRSVSSDFFDANTDGFVSTLTFSNPPALLVVKLGMGRDTLSIGAFDPDFGVPLDVEGGSGSDTLVGPDGANAWDIIGPNAGGLNSQVIFSSVENLIGGSGQDIFVFAEGADIAGLVDGGSGGPNTLDYSATSSDITISLGVDVVHIDVLVGGAGSDTLIGLPDVTTWNIMSPGGGTVITTDEDGALIAEVTFSGFENLTGSVGDDTIVFADGMGVSGLIDGGGGTNGLDYSLYSAANSVTVDLGKSESTDVASFRNIQSVIGGGSDGDTLVGPKEESTWKIKGVDSGEVGGVSFAGFENLTGSADNEDGFIILIGGSLRGTLDGGRGGSDSFAVEDPDNPGAFTVIVPDSTGEGTLTVSNVFADDERMITYKGMEPSLSVDAADPENIEVETSILAEDLVLEAGPLDGQLQLRHVSSATLPVLFWDVAAGGYAGDTQVFDIPSGSITIDLRGGDDSLTISSIDTLGAALIIDTGGVGINAGALRPGGMVALGMLTAGPLSLLGAGLLIDLPMDDDDSVIITGDVRTGGGNIAIEAEDIRVASNVTLSTRDTLGGVTGASVDDSGDLALIGHFINIESGARLLAYDDRDPAPDPLKIPAGIDNLSSPGKNWTPGMSYTDVATTSEGLGTRLTVDIVTDTEGNPTVRLATRGTGYEDNETITVHDPDEVGGDITVQVNGLMLKGGDIVLRAERNRFSTIYETADASVTITNAMLSGRDVSIIAEADNDSLFDGDKSKGKQFFEGILDLLANVRPLVGVSIVKATADVVIGEGTVIESDGNVEIRAHSNSEANIKTLGIAAGVGYGRSESDATVTLQSGVVIHAAGNVALSSLTDNTMQVDASAKKDIEAIPLDVMVAISEAYSHAATTVSAGASITADGDVGVLANSTKKLGTSAKSSGKFDMLGSAVVVAISDATSEAIVDGKVTSTNGDVSVLANTTSTKNLTKAESLQGDNTFVTVNDWMNSTTPLKILKETGKKLWPPVKDWVSGLFKKESKKTEEKTSEAPEKEQTNWAEKYSKFGGAVAVAVGIHKNEATARIGTTADVESGGNVTVKADVLDRQDITASSVITAGTDVNKKTKEKKKVGKEYVGSISVLVGDYTNHSTAVIDSGATVDAPGEILVDSQTLIPYQLNWNDFIGVFEGKELKDLFDALKDIDIGPNGFVSSWAMSAAEGNVAGLAGSVNVFIVNNTSTALIGEGASINQTVDGPGQDVTVKAGNEFDSINLVGQFMRILKQTDPEKAKGKTGGIGGSFGGFFYDNITRASIESGALVDADNLVVDARTTTNNIVLGLAGGLPLQGGEAAKFAVSGAVTVVDMDNQTLAKIDDGAFVSADGTVDVNAVDDVLNVNIVGGIVQGRSLGFGITAGINVINRDTKAIVGNQESVLGRGEFAPNTGVNNADNTIDLGYAHGFNTGDAVVYSNGGGENIGGLTDGDTYYVRVINSSTLRLARSIEEANEDGDIFFSADDVDDSEDAETIDLGYDHGYQTGDAVVYRNGGGESIGGLNDGQTYYIIRISETKVQLAEMLDEALSETPSPVNLDLSLGGLGTAHSLHLDLDPSASSGSSHSLGIGFEPSTPVNDAEGTINLGYEHGFATGQKVTYSHGGGKSIGGLESKGTYYVIVVDPTTIRLAESRWQALEGTYIDLDSSTAEGASHTIGAGFQPIPVVDGTSNTIVFEGAHGLSEGQAIVYDSGGGTPVGGLTSGDTYYVNSIDAHTIKLARTALEAREDAVTFFGLDDLDSTGGSGTVIDLGYDHGFKTGDAVVYHNGGGESIGGLNEGQTYYVIRESDTAIKLSKTAEGSAFDLNTLQGSGNAHSLRLALDPVMATGTGHTLFEPDDVNGSLSSGGKTTVSAKNDGLMVTATIAAAKTGDKATSKKDKKGKEAPGGGGTYGVALSGSVSVNTVFDNTQAYVSDSFIAQSNGLELLADESTLIVAVSGAAALSTNQKGSFGLAGAVTVNYIDNETLAYIHNSTLEDIGALTVRSEATGKIIGIAAGLSGATKGTSIAGSVGVNLIFGDTDAYVDAGSVIGGTTGVFIAAKDLSSIIAVAGALAYGGKAGIGAGVAVNYIDCSTDAYVADSDVITSGTLAVSAQNDSDILAIAAAIGASKGTMAAAVSVSVNLISNDTHAYLLGTKTDDGISADGGISLTATDTSDIDVYAGGIALAFGRGSGDEKKKESKSKAFTLGASIAINDIDNDVYATIDGAKVSSAGNVELLATSTPTIYALTIAGAVGVSGGGQGKGFTFAGAGAGSGNTIKNTVEAGIKNGSTVTTTGTGSVKLTATDTSTITADAGGVGIALAGGQGGGTALTAGVSVAINHIENQIHAIIDHSTVTAAGGVGLSATSTATIDALTIAAAIGASGGQGRGFSFAGAGAGSGNTIKNIIEAGIKNGSVVTTANTGSVTLTATDTSKIIADAGGLGIALAGGQGGGTALTAGVSVAINHIENQIHAIIDHSTATAAGSVGLSATSTATIDALTIAAAIGAAGGQGGGFSFAGAGAGSGNTIRNTVEAGIKNGSTVTTTGTGLVKLSATDTSKIIADAGGVGVALAGGQGGGASISVGVSMADNEIGNQVLALIDASTVTSAAGVTLSASSTGTIDAFTFGGAVAISGGAGGGLSGAGSGSEATNWIHNTVSASIQNGSSVTTNNAGSVSLTATDSATITADVAGGSVSIAAGAGGAGAISIGAAIADNDINSIVSAYINNATVISAGDVNLLATSTSNIDAFAIAVSISAAIAPASLSLSGAGADATNDTISQIFAYIDDVDGTVGDISTVTAKGNVNLSATDSSTATADLGSGALNIGVVGASVGVSLSSNTINNTVKAYIDHASVTAESGGIDVTAGSTGFIDALAVATSVAISIGGAGAGGDADATITTGVEAYAGSGATLSAEQDILIKAASDYDATADVYGIAVGLLAIGGSVATANANGAVTARMDGSVTKGGNVTIEASADSYADAAAFALAGGILTGAGADTSAKASPTVSAHIGDGLNTASITNVNSIKVISRSKGEAIANTDGVSVGGLSMGVSLADAEVSPTISTYVAPLVTLDAKTDIILMSLHNFDADNETPLIKEAHAEADSSGGSLLLSLAGSEGTAHGSAKLHTYVAQGTSEAPTTITAGGEFSLISKANNRAYAEGTGVLVSLGLAAGASFADVNNDELNRASNLAHFSGDSLKAQDVTIIAETIDYAKAHTLAGAGALLATGVGAESNALVNSTTTAYVGSGSDIRAYNSFSMTAEETPEALADSQGVSVGLFGLSVGVSLSDAQTTPEVRSYIEPNSNIVTGIFVTGDPTLTFQSEAKLTPDPLTSLNFIQGNVTTVQKTATFNFWGTPFTYTYTVNEIAGAKIIRSGGSWLDEGFAAGQTINVGGAVSSRGSYKIKEVTDLEITLENGYQVAQENAVSSALVLMTADLADSIQRDSGKWRDDGFREGHSIRITGSDRNDGVYRIKSISQDGTTLTLTTDSALTNESGPGMDVAVAPEVCMVGAPVLNFNTEAYFLGGANLAFNPILDQNTQKSIRGTITRDAGKWSTDGFLPGYKIDVYGSAGNDGEYEVLSITDDALTVERIDGKDIQSEVNITPLIRQELPDTITRKSGSWSADGFLAGQRIRITNSLLNDGTYRVQSISTDGKVLTLNPDRDGDGNADDLNQLTNDPDDTGVTITAVGEGLGGLAGDLTVVALQSLPASGISAMADGSASSGSLLLSGAGTDNQATNNSSVYAYVGSGSTLRFTGNADLNAATFATQRTTSDGVSVGALAGGASLAEADSISDTQAYFESAVSVRGGNLRVFAGGADDSEAWAEVGTGGIIAGGDADASTHTVSQARAYLAPKTDGESLPFTVRSLEIASDHTSRFDSVAVSRHGQLAGASLSSAVNLATSQVDASIGANLVIEAEDITVEAMNRTDKPLRTGDRANLRGASGGLADLPLSNTSYTEFTSATNVEVGDGAKLTTVSGDRDKPGNLYLLANNDINAWDYVVMDSGGLIAIPIAFSLINGAGNVAAVEVGEQAELRSDGDIEMSARTEAWLNSQTQVSTYGLAGAGWGGSAAILNAENLVTAKDGAVFEAGRNIYLLAGTERMGDINHIDLDAKTDIWNNTVVPLGPLGAGIANLLPGPTETAEAIMHNILAAAGLEVPAEARLHLENLVMVEPDVAMTGVSDAYFYTMEGDVEVTGKGKAKDLYSEILGALSGGALEWGGGRSIVDTVSGVEMNGSVDVGIRNQQRLTIDEVEGSTFDSYDSYKINATVQDEGVSFTVQEESLLLNLVNALERAQELRAQYDDYNDQNVTPTEAAFDAEIARIEQQLVDMGFSSNPETGVTSIEKNSLVRFIVVDPILAQSANVNIKGDYLVGKGLLKARGETEITIINKTQYYLRTSDLIIPEEVGGRIWVNNREISELVQIENLNRKVPIQATLDLTLEPGTLPGTTPEPDIFIENTRGVREVSADVSLPAPDIELAGDILDLTGSLTVRSLGSITAIGSIQANDIDLGAEGSFVQTYVDGLWSAGGDPKAAYSNVVATYEYAKKNRKDYATPLTALENQARQNLANQAAIGGIIVGDSVFISARYLNINGKIQSGQPMQTLLLSASLDTTIENLKAQYDSQLLSGQNPDPRILLNPWLPNTAYGSLSPVKAFYDYDEDRIELDPIVVKGGYIELVGEIISTGFGKIEVRDGYGNIDVKNDTSYDLLVQGVDVGSAAKGKLVITDLAASRLNLGMDRENNPAALKTIFTGDGASVQIEDNYPDGLVAASLTGARTAQYNPVDGVRYEWVRGQAFTLVEKITYRSSSWLGVDALAKDPGNIYKTQLLFKDEDGDGQPDLVPLLQGEYTRVDTSITSQYDYSFQQVNTDVRKQVGDEIRWDEKSGFWGLGRTYYAQVTYETGLKNFHKHSIKADSPIQIEFIGGSQGEVSIKSANNLLISGAVKNAGGSTSLEAGWDSNPSDSKAPNAGAEIRVTSDTARITSEQISLAARAGIGEHSPVRVDLQEGGWLSALTGSGDIELVEISGDMTVDYVGTTGAGRVVLEAPGSLMPYDGDSLIRGNKVELAAKSGGIGSSSQWLQVDSAVGIDHAENAGFVAQATGDIYLKEIDGDLYLVQAEAVDLDGNPTGNVNLWASDGSIRDYLFAEEVKEDTFNELLALADEVGLRGSAAQARADANVAAFEASKEAEYHSYWGYRNQQRVTVSAAEGLSFSFNKTENTITRSSGTWTDDGFTDYHQTIYISGSGNGNDGQYEVDHIDAATIWLKTETPLVADETDLAAGAKVIGEIPASLVTIELTDGQESYLRDELGFNDDQVAAYETNLTDQYRYLDTVYGSQGDYEDPDWAYTLKPEEDAALRRGAQWDDDALTFGISPALFKTTSTVIEEEEPNIRGLNIDLRASGGLGAYKASLAVDLSSGFSGLSDQEKVALAAAERDDVRYFGDDSALMAGNPTLNFDASNRAITRSSGSWLADGFEAAEKIWVEGTSANAGRAYLVKSVTETVITLEETEKLTGETGVQGLMVGQFGVELDQLTSARMFGTPTLTFDAAAGTITRDDAGSWVTDGFLAGKKIWVVGTAFNNGQAFLIEGVTDQVITVSSATPVQNEAATGARVGQVLVARMTIDQREDVDVEVPGDITIQVNRHLFLGSEIDINLNQVVSGEQMILRTVKGILNTAGPGETNIVTSGPAGNVILEAGGGNIGAQLDQSNNLMVQPILVDLYDGAALSARADGNIYITETGNMYLGEIYAPEGSVELSSGGSIYDGVGNNEVNIESLSLHLNAVDAIGTTSDFLDIDQIIPGGQASIGEAKVQAGGDVFLRDPVGNFYVDEIRSTGGNVSLEAAVSIVDAAGENNVADVIGRSITLNATMGGIGLPFTGDLDVDTDSSNSGVLTAYSALNAYLFEVDEDLLLMQVGTAAGYTAFIQSPGRILNGNPGGANVISGATRLYAASDIGVAGNPLSTQVGKLEGYSETGDVWISNTGPLTVGGVSELEGISAVGGVVIKASSPVTVEEPIRAKDITIETRDGVGPGDDIVVQKDVTLWSEEGKVSLKAGDNLFIEEGATIRAATTVELFGDWSEEADPDPDPGIGATIDPRGQILAESVWIFGGADGDVIDLSHLGVDATVSGGEGSDTLIGPDGDNIWEITGANSGKLTNQDRAWTFDSVENLTSGDGNDIFYFRGQGSVDGVVDGGAGWDILDFLQSDFIQEAAASFLVTDLSIIGDDPVDFAATGGIVHIEDILVILLAEVQQDGTLVLNMGPRAAERLAINTVDGDEEFILTHVAGDPEGEKGETIGVKAFGIYLEYPGVRAIWGSGGLGDDTISLSSDIMAPAELDGGPVDDLLVGGAGADVLRGGAGNDTLEGGAGNDVMDGGWGDDRYVIVPGSTDKVIDVQGVDTLDFSKAVRGVRVDLSKSRGHIQKIDSAGNQLRLYGMIENAVGSEFNDVIYGNWLNNTLEGRGGDDWLFGSYGNDTLEGGDGRDQLYGEWGNDRLAGGAGNDYIEGGYGEDLLFFPGALTGVTVNLTCGGNGWSTDGLGGVDTLRRSIEGAIGTEFDDTLVGDDSRNVFHGMAGNDFIDGRGGDDVLYGGEGVDRIFAGWGNDLVVWAEGEGNDTIDMGDGWDRVRITTGDSDDWVYLSSPAKNKVTIEGAGSTVWSLSVTKGDIFEIYTGGGDDIVAVGNLKRTDVDEVVLYLGDGNDKVDGTHASGTIRAYGQAGNDLFIGGWGKDTFDGGEGSDWVDYSSAPRRVHVDLAWGASQDGKGSKDYLKSIENVIGTQFDDMIWGTDGANIIIALGGDDHVWARGGDDIVYGGAGNDKLWGDDGNDTLMGDGGDDMLWGGRGDDRLYGGTGNDRLWGDGGDDELFGDDGDDRLEGGDGDDLLKGGSGNDTLDGGWGNDRLFGGDGDDRLYGGWGDDELFGEDGNDLLVGDHGDDKLDGGAGVNKLVDWPDKQKDCGDHGHGPFDKTTVSPCASWVNTFVTALGRDLGKNDPNEKIQITLPVVEKEKPGFGCKGGKR